MACRDDRECAPVFARADALARRNACARIYERPRRSVAAVEPGRPRAGRVLRPERFKTRTEHDLAPVRCPDVHPVPRQYSSGVRSPTKTPIRNKGRYVFRWRLPMRSSPYPRDRWFPGWFGAEIPAFRESIVFLDVHARVGKPLCRRAAPASVSNRDAVVNAILEHLRDGVG